MYDMATRDAIREWVVVQRRSQRSAARQFGVSRETVARLLAEPAAACVTDASGTPLVSGRESPLPGLFFCGFHVAPTGMLREIGIEAQRIARAIGAGRHTPV